MKLPVGMLWDEVMVTLQIFPSQNKGYKMETWASRCPLNKQGTFYNVLEKVGKDDDLFNMRTSELAQSCSNK